MLKKILCAASIALLAAGSASASTIALQWSNSGSSGSSSFTRGWGFSTNTAINISSIGWFDFGNDGLATSHQVGIWNTSGELLMSGNVAAGTLDPLLAGFRYSSALTGTTMLMAGTYVVAGLSSSADDTWRYVDSSDVTMGSAITFLGDRTSNTEVFEYAGSQQGFDVGYFGANFQYDVANAVPEPSTLPLSAIGLAALGAAAYSRRRSKAV